MTERGELEALMAQRIEDAGGLLPFEQFMQAALYEPQLGYYERRTVFGAAGDFVTAPDLGPWLSLGLADLIHDRWQQLGEPQQWVLIEQGGGSGRLMVALLKLLDQFSMPMPTTVIAVEKSAQLRARQADLFAAQGMVVEMVAALDALSAMESVIYYSNELPDAFPVACFRYRQGSFYPRGVALDKDGFCWRDGATPVAAPAMLDDAVVAQWPEDYISEWNPGLAAWQQSLARVIARGFVLTIDYGYAQREYYRPNRIEGTLLAHVNQQTDTDVLAQPGSRDITAHVDFTALARLGAAVGLTPQLWMSQGGWLAQSPSVQALLQSLAVQGDADSVRLLAHAKRLLMPFGMGEQFKLLIQARGLHSEQPAYLRQFDHLDALQS